MVRRMHGERNVVGRSVQSGKFPLGKYPVVEVFVKELFFGKVSAWDMSMRKCQSGN